MVNIQVLIYELLLQNLPVIGVSESPSEEFPDCRLDWTEGHPTSEELTLARAVYAAHDPNKLLPEDQAAKDAVTNYAILPDWLKTGTANQAETYITNQIFNGQTIDQVNTWIDTNIINVTTANVTQINARLDAIRTVFKAAAGAIITMRELFIVVAKLLVYIRDLVIRFRT